MPHEFLTIAASLGVPVQIAAFVAAFWHLDRRLVRLEQNIKDWIDK